MTSFNSGRQNSRQQPYDDYFALGSKDGMRYATKTSFHDRDENGKKILT